MKGVDSIEFYLEGAVKYISRVESSMVPPVGSLVSIRAKTYEVLGFTFAVDHADEFMETAMRCNVEVAPYKEKPKRSKRT